MEGAKEMGPAVIVGGILHESNSFNPEKTTWADFVLREGADAESTLANWASDHTEVAGFVEEGARRNFRFLPALYAAATPKGPVDAETFERLTGRLLSAISAADRVDGVLLALHGAMFTEEFPHGDEEIVRRVRAAIGPSIPFVVTHDFHANVPPGLVAATDALVIYQQNPHVDTKQRGIVAASILGRTMGGESRPTQAIAKPPMVWNIVHQNTFAEPLLSITRASMDLEKQPGILAASVSGGYQYNDVPYLGPSVVVVTDDDRERAQREANTLADAMWQQRDRTRLSLPDAAAAVAQAMRAKHLPVALFEAADNIGGGAPGDETFVLAELLKQGARGWVAVLFDPPAVEAAKRAGIGGPFDRLVGAASASSFSKPVRVRGAVRSLHSGRYIEPEVRHGGQRYWEMGHTAVIEAEGSSPEDLNLLVVTAERSSPNSLHQLISCGIYPERQKILLAKGTIAPRAAYEPVAAEIILVDTPGVTAVDPAHFEFKRVRPSVWGLQY